MTSNSKNVLFPKGRKSARTGRATKSVAASLAAAGLFSLALGAAPAMAQIPANITGTHNDYLAGQSSVGDVTVNWVRDNPWNNYTPAADMTINFGGGAWVKGNLDFQANRVNFFDSVGDPAGSDQGNITATIAGLTKIYGSLQSTGADYDTLTVNVSNGAKLLVGGNLENIISNAGAWSDVSLGVGGAINQTGINMKGGDLYLTESTTGLGNVTITSNGSTSGGTTITTLRVDAGTFDLTTGGAGNLKIGGANGDLQLRVGDKAMTITTVDGDVSFDTGYAFGGANVTATGAGNTGALTVNAGDGSGGTASNIAFGGGVDLDVSANGNVTNFQADQNITTTGAYTVAAGAGNHTATAIKGNFTAGETTVSSTSGKIGITAGDNVNIANNLSLTSTSGDISVASLGEIATKSALSVTGTTTVSTAGNITLAAAEDLKLTGKSDIQNATGTNKAVTIAAGNDLSMEATSVVKALGAGSTVSVTADHNATLGGTFQTTTGALTVGASNILTLNGDLTATTTAGALTVGGSNGFNAGANTVRLTTTAAGGDITVVGTVTGTGGFIVQGASNVSIIGPGAQSDGFWDLNAAGNLTLQSTDDKVEATGTGSGDGYINVFSTGGTAQILAKTGISAAGDDTTYGIRAQGTSATISTETGDVETTGGLNSHILATATAGAAEISATQSGITSTGDIKADATGGGATIYAGLGAITAADGLVSAVSDTGAAAISAQLALSAKAHYAEGATSALITSTDKNIEATDGNIEAKIIGTDGSAIISAATGISATGATAPDDGNIIATAMGTGLAGIGTTDGDITSTGRIEATAEAGDTKTSNAVVVAATAGSILAGADDNDQGLLLESTTGNIFVTAGDAITVEGLTDVVSAGGDVQIVATNDIDFQDTSTYRLTGTAADTGVNKIVSTNGNLTFGAQTAGDYSLDYQGDYGDLLISAKENVAFNDATIFDLSNNTNGVTRINSIDGDIDFTSNDATKAALDYTGVNGDVVITAEQGAVTFNAGTNYDFGTGTGGTIIRALTITHNNAPVNSVSDHYEEWVKGSGEKLEYFDSPLDITTTQATGSYVHLWADGGITFAKDTTTGSSLTIDQVGDGYTYIKTITGDIDFDADSAFSRTAETGDLTVRVIGAGDITFGSTYSNIATTGAALQFAQNGNITFEDMMEHEGGQFAAVVGSSGNAIAFEDDATITITAAAAADADPTVAASGAYIRTVNGPIEFNKTTSTAGTGFSFTGRNGDLIILAAIQPEDQIDNALPTDTDYPDTGDYVADDITDTPPSHEVPPLNDLVGSNITFYADTNIDFTEGGTDWTGNTLIATGNGDIEFNKREAVDGFTYHGGGGNLSVITADGNITFYDDATADFTGAAGTGVGGTTWLAAYKGNVHTLGTYDHIGGFGDRKVLAVSETGTLGVQDTGNIREANFRFTAGGNSSYTKGGGSALWAATGRIDLNIFDTNGTWATNGPDGYMYDADAVIGTYTALGMELDFSSVTSGGVAITAADDITVFNSFTYTGGTGTGLATTDVTDQAWLLDGIEGVYGTALADYLPQTGSPLPVGYSGYAAFIQDHGLFLYTPTRLYMGDNFSLDMGTQSGFVQAPVVVTRGNTTFDTTGGGDLTFIADFWNIMDDLTINGNNATVSAMTTDFNDRDMPILTLQGRIDHYMGGTTNPNLFDDSIIGGLGDININDQQIVVEFTDNNGVNPLNIFQYILSANATTSFATDANTGAYVQANLRADLLTSYGVEAFAGTGDGLLSGHVRMVSNATLESLDDQTKVTTAGLYATRWNLGENTYKQAGVEVPTLQTIFDATRQDVYGDGDFAVDALGNPVTDMEGVRRGQPGPYDLHADYSGLGTEGNASWNYIRDSLMMEKTTPNPCAFGGSCYSEGVISWQALQSKLVFDNTWVTSTALGQGNFVSSPLLDPLTTHLEMPQLDFYGWMNIRDARTVMAASMYNGEENITDPLYPGENIHNARLDAYDFDPTKGGTQPMHPQVVANRGYENVIWLEADGATLDQIPGFSEAGMYNPFPSSPFFNLKVGYLDPADKTTAGLIKFERKMYSGSTPADLANQAPKGMRGMAWAIEAAQAFDAMDVPTHVYTENGLRAEVDPTTGLWKDHNGNILDPEGILTPGAGIIQGAAAADYIQNNLKWAELSDLQVQHDNGYAYEYDRHHSLENILYLSPTRRAYNEALTMVSAGGNLDAARLVNFNNFDTVFTMLGDRAAQNVTGWYDRDEKTGTGLWGLANYRRTNVDGNISKGFADFDVDQTSVLIGYDRQVIDERLLLGVYFGYTNGELDGWHRNIDADDVQIGVYGQAAFDYDFFLNFGLAYGWQSYDLDRTVALGRSFQNNCPIGFGEKLDGDFDGNSFQIDLELAKYFRFDNNFYLRPSIGYSYQHVTFDDYTETSRYRYDLAGDPMNVIPSVAQRVRADDFDRHIFRLGTGAGWKNEAETVEVTGKVYWLHNGGDDQATGRASFASTAGDPNFAGSYGIYGAEYDDNVFNYGVGVKFTPTDDKNLSFNLGFDAYNGSKEDSYAGTVGIMYQY